MSGACWRQRRPPPVRVALGTLRKRTVVGAVLRVKDHHLDAVYMRGQGATHHSLCLRCRGFLSACSPSEVWCSSCEGKGRMMRVAEETAGDDVPWAEVTPEAARKLLLAAVEAF